LQDVIDTKTTRLIIDKIMRDLKVTRSQTKGTERNYITIALNC
jgi:hypothetical protein